MRVALAGTRSFGAAVLATVVDAGHDVAQVIAPEGDKTASAARRLGLPLAAGCSPDTLPPRLDLIVAAHSHAFVGRRSRAATVLGAVGYHPSLLPRHRGRDAVRWTVHMGDPIAGGSVYWLTDTVDAGPVAAQGWCFVRPGDDASTLWRRELFPMGVELICRVLARLDAGEVVARPQDERVATWEPSWERPPLHRPELPELGSLPSGYRIRER